MSPPAPPNNRLWPVLPLATGFLLLIALGVYSVRARRPATLPQAITNASFDARGVRTITFPEPTFKFFRGVITP